jgi:two-component system, LytTR family, response regulator
MKVYNCLIVDDEVAAHEVLISYITRLPYLEVMAQAYDAVEAEVIIKQNAIDIVFLDINMPEVSGLEFILKLKTPPILILTTAYTEYALDAFDLGVVDYLVKPIPYNRFLKCIYKVTNTSMSFIEKKEEKSITLKIDGTIKTLLYDDINYFQALGNYVKVVTHQKSHLTILTMQDLEKKLDQTAFIRVHKSFIVPRTVLNKHQDFLKIDMGDQIIPIGRSYKIAVQNFLTAYLPNSFRDK